MTIEAQALLYKYCIIYIFFVLFLTQVTIRSFVIIGYLESVHSVSIHYNFNRLII